MENATGSEWTDFYNDGKRYLEVLTGAADRPDKFTPEILYNMACMAIEKLFMAYFIREEFMPYNHTLPDLVESIKIKETIPESLERKLLEMGGFQEICSIDAYRREVPSWDDVPGFIEITGMTRSYIDKLLKSRRDW